MRLVRGGEDTFLELKVKLSNTERVTQEIVALANTGGGVIVFGVNDQMRVEGVDDSEDVQEELVRICREDICPPLVPFIDRIAFDNGRRIVALEVEGRRRPYRTKDGRFYIRIGSEKREATRLELSSLLDEARPLSYENVLAIGAEMADIDEAHLWSFLREFEGDAFSASSMTGTGFSTQDVLERHLLLAFASGSEVVPTVAGILLFGRDDRVPELLPRSRILLTRFAGDSTQAAIVERMEIQGNLYSLYESSLRFIARYCDLWDARPRTFPAAEVAEAPIAARPNYHRHVVSEGLANMLVHRDLALREQSTRIHLFDRSLDIINARRTAGFAPSAQKAIRYGVPQRVNPQLAAIFSNPAYGLSLAGGGLPKLLRESRLFSARNAEIHAFSDEFRLRLYAA
jgi:ATP-dependent DNA helicase RecG